MPRLVDVFRRLVAATLAVLTMVRHRTSPSSADDSVLGNSSRSDTSGFRMFTSRSCQGLTPQLACWWACLLTWRSLLSKVISPV